MNKSDPVNELAAALASLTGGEPSLNYQDDWQTIAELVKRVETANKIVAEQNRLIADLFSRFVPEMEKPTVILGWDRAKDIP